MESDEMIHIEIKYEGEDIDLEDELDEVAELPPPKKAKTKCKNKTTKGGGLHMFGVSLSCFLQKINKSLHVNARSVERNILLSEHMVLEI